MTGLILKDLVANQSNKEYEIDFDEINISLIDKQIDIHQLKLIKSKDALTDTSRQVYSIVVPKLELSVGSIFALYFEKSLTIQGIKIHNPDILIAKSNESAKKTSLSFETGALYNAISKYIYAFSINNLEIENAKVEYSKSEVDDFFQFIVDEIDFRVDNFLIDSVATSFGNKFLYSDRIELIISNQKYLLGDSIHNITFDEFHISTSTGDILFKNLKLLPRSGIELSQLATYYDVKIPELNFRGLDFNKAYSQNILELDSIRLLNPIIKVKKTALINSKKEQTDLLAQSTKLFEKFQIKKLYVDNGDVDININDQNLYRSKELNLEMESIAIDSAIIASGDFTKFFKEISIDSKTIRTYLMDSTHVLNAKHVSYSTKSAEFEINKLRVFPISQKVKTRISVVTDRIKLDGLASISDMLEGKISMDHIWIDNPSVDLSTLGNKQSKLDSSKIEFIQYIAIGAFSLTKGDILFTAPNANLDVKRLDINLDKINFQPADLKYFVFNSFSPKSHFDFRSLSFNSDQINLEMNQLNLNNWKDLEAKDILIKPQTFKDPLTFASVKVTEFDLDHFLHNQLLAFDSLIVDEPVIKIHPNKSANTPSINLVDWSHHTTFKEMHFLNGKLTKYGEEGVEVHLENFDIELAKFHYDSIKDEYYTQLGYKSDSIFVHLTAMNHTLTGTELDVSIQDSTLHIKQLNLKPLLPSSNKRFNITTSELRLRQLDFHKLINQQQIHFNKGYLLSPKADIYIESLERNREKLPKGLLAFNALNVANGHIHLENHVMDSSMFLDINKMNMLVNEFDLGKDSTLFSATNYLGELEGISFKNYETSDSLKLSKATINTKKGSIVLSDLSLSPSLNSKLYIPSIRIEGLDAEVLAFNKMFMSSSVILESPRFTIDMDKPFSKGTKSENRNIPSVNLGYFGINNGFAALNNEHINLGNTFNINRINLSIDTLAIDSTSTLLSLSQFLTETRLSVEDLSSLTPDSLYRLHLDSLAYSGQSNTIHLIGVNLDPIFTKSELLKRIEYQKDWFDLKIKSIDLSGVNVAQMITNGFLELDQVAINQFNLDTHKDKRLPLPPNNEKPLPQEMISQLPIPIYIDSINIISSYVSHSEFSPTGTLPGLIFFKDMNGVIKNITNDSARLAENKIMTFHSTGSMMHTGKYEVDVDFDLSDTSQFFYFEGQLTNMDLTELNELLENTAYVRIKDGYNKKVTFNFEANHDYALGEMKFYYNNLKITVLKSDDQEHKRHAASIKSFFANTFVVNKKNPHFLFVRQGDIFHHRDVNKAIFNYWAKALLSGVVSSIGAKNNKKEIKKFNEELKAEMDRKRAETLDLINSNKD